MDSSHATTSTTLTPDEPELYPLSDSDLKSHGNAESVESEPVSEGRDHSESEAGGDSESEGGGDSDSEAGEDFEPDFESEYEVDSESEAVETLKIESESKSEPSKMPASVELKSKSAPLGPSDPSDPNGPSDPSDPKSILLSAITGDFSHIEKFIGIPLAQVIKKDRKYVIRMLNATSEPLKRNLLHWAVIYNERDILRWFYDYRRAGKHSKNFMRFINAQDVYGYTSLHLAVQRKYEDIVKGLLSHSHIDVCIPAENMLACEDNGTKSNRLTPLHIAARNGSLSIVKMILEFLENSDESEISVDSAISTKSTSGKTVLHYPAEGGDWQIVRYLLETLKMQGENKTVNDCDVLRQTPLYLAAWKQNVEALEVLLREGEGLKVNTVTWEGITALDIAKKNGNQHHVPEGQEHVNRRIVDMLESVDVNWLQAERSKYANAANSLLVGAALVAGVTYAGWLQPPLGYSSVESYAGVEEHPEIQLFWFFNSMSFFFSVATFIIGADASIPERCASLREEVVQLRNSVVCLFCTLRCNLLCHWCLCLSRYLGPPSNSKTKGSHVCYGYYWGESLCNTLGIVHSKAMEMVSISKLGIHSRQRKTFSK